MPNRQLGTFTVGLGVCALLWIAGCGLSSPIVPIGTPPAFEFPGGDSGSDWPADDPGGSTGESSSAGSDGGVATIGCEPVGSPDGAVRSEMYQALNFYRLQQGRTALAYSDTLEAAANAHARDMYVRNFFNHENPDGEGPMDRALQAGFCELTFVAENIASGQRSVTEVQTGWENSPGHNANMLHDTPTLVGMGHYAAPTGVRYWVQVFARSGF